MNQNVYSNSVKKAKKKKKKKGIKKKSNYKFFPTLFSFSLALDITHFLVQLNSRWILQLNKVISKDCQKLNRYFNGAVNISLGIGFPKIFDLHLNDAKLFIPTLSVLSSSVRDDSSLLNCHKLPDVLE